MGRRAVAPRLVRRGRGGEIVAQRAPAVQARHGGVQLMARRVTILLLIAVLLQGFDQYSTLVLFQYGGIEANPLAVWLFGIIGVEWTIILLKTIGVGVICLIVYICDERKSVKILGLINVYYFILLGAFNFRYLLRVFLCPSTEGLNRTAPPMY
ncbi:MAG: DUF5658 family protein [Desulfobacterales bacterium]|nr:DUF5658 family protein [Desulfobacterales bacterium]